MPASRTTKRALIILDGLGDRAHPATGDMSPVEAATTPNLDRLGRAGQYGTVTIIGAGVAPESDAGVLSLLGYDPVTGSPGRGVLEALGIGAKLEPGDVALRLNFATRDAAGVIVDSRVGRSLSTGEAEELALHLTEARLVRDQGVEAEVRATVGHRGVLVLRTPEGEPLSPSITNADPFYTRVGGMGAAAAKVDRPTRPAVAAVGPDPAARRTADALNSFLERADARLEREPLNRKRAAVGQRVANTLLVRNAGTFPRPSLRSFASVSGWRGAAVTEMPVERGIAQLIGLADEYVGPMGEYADAGYRERARVTRAAIERHPFVYVHLKGPDEPGHDGDADKKRRVIEAIDRSFFGPFLEGLDLESVRLAVTADHATPCVLKGHSDDPVPLVVSGAGVEAKRSGTGKFSERTAARGSLGAVHARDVLPLLGRASL